MDLGIDAGRLEMALKVLCEGIENGAMPGAVVCGMRRGNTFVHRALGTVDGQRKNSVDTIYDLASITKPMATAASVLRLVEDGKLTLMQTAGQLLGEAAGKLANVNVGQLLTHTSGLPAHARLWENGKGLDSAVASIVNLPVALAGTKYEYSCLGFILLGKIVEIVSGLALDEFATRQVFEPLKLKDTRYRPGGGESERIAPTRSLEVVFDREDKERPLGGVVHDGNARGIGGVSGNAGLFGTAMDVARFGQEMLAGNFFATATTARILNNQLRPELGGHSLMFFAQPNPLCPAGDLLSPRAVGHSGYTGNVLTIDPEHDLVMVVLTNRVFIDSDGSKWLTVRRKFLNALAASLV